MADRMNDGVAIAALSVAVVEVFKMYRETAPPLAQIRAAEPYDLMHRQLILDADMLGLIVAVAIGGGGAFLTKKLYPLALSLSALALISSYYRSVLRSTNNVGMRVNEY